MTRVLRGLMGTMPALQQLRRRARAARVAPTCLWLAALTLGLLCDSARADDPRSTYLIKLLEGSSQFRVRAQAAISLGAVEGSSAAAQALTAALRDT